MSDTIGALIRAIGALGRWIAGLIGWGAPARQATAKLGASGRTQRKPRGTVLVNPPAGELTDHKGGLWRAVLWDVSESGICVAIRGRQPQLQRGAAMSLRLHDPVTAITRRFRMELMWTKTEGQDIYLGLKLRKGSAPIRGSFLQRYLPHGGS
ncbi:PilZ domain-containing protein [Vulcanococcus limneticus Candia 3F8]|uniref:PilZ domain-containing protein n=1 Tax=Vulcanococcus limneticus TaxID=2170428 RepID=UPI000B98CC34|nr:PilZ domain-containing protein [Vulcanococcus limneticus]MCP9792664.1 PilZ domain-containing protein [Vulcanococcus limneticus MW73D5]MCP9894445.1 PilZ domain-containing protein [Vulcanococcus limneticus Candia 3F8]MCP9898018.1 PilZ domain-containing protein [Vulcanococcus limneticus Candia 3B3]